MARKLLEARTVTLVMLAFMLLGFTLPIRRVIYEWGNDPSHPFSMLFNGHIWLPVLVLLAMIILETGSGWRSYPYWQRLSSPHVVLPAAYAVLLVCMVLALARVPGLWWTWLTVGIHMAGCVLIYNKVRSRLTSGASLMVALGFICIAAFLWECAYQAAFYLKYYRDELPTVHLYNQWRFMLPLLIAGLLPVTIYYGRLARAFRLSRLVAVPAALFVSAWVVWLACGFWVDILYDFDVQHWVSTDSNYVQMGVYKSSKVLLNLIPVAALRGAA